MERGFAVTWDNPDIQLKLHGNPVSSSLITPDVDLREIVARIWNGSAGRARRRHAGDLLLLPREACSR